jgi:hypothetical protein
MVCKPRSCTMKLGHPTPSPLPLSPRPSSRPLFGKSGKSGVVIHLHSREVRCIWHRRLPRLLFSLPAPESTTPHLHKP